MLHIFGILNTLYLFCHLFVCVNFLLSHKLQHNTWKTLNPKSTLRRARPLFFHWQKCWNIIGVTVELTAAEMLGQTFAIFLSSCQCWRRHRWKSTQRPWPHTQNPIKVEFIFIWPHTWMSALSRLYKAPTHWLLFSQIFHILSIFVCLGERVFLTRRAVRKLL